MAKYDDIVNLALRRSIFYPASEIYANSPAGMFDYGPYGAAVKRKIVELWRKELVQKEDFIEIDGAQIMPADVFKASGHLKSFADPITQCKKCNTIYRADKLLSEATGESFPEAMLPEEYTKEIETHKLKCQKCKGELLPVVKFNLMVKADVGMKSKNDCYLRPESCQSIFVDFARMNKTMRMKLPKGISQYGRVFRNEISPRQTLIRSVEFSQMETEIFFDPEKINEVENFDEVKDYKVRICRS
ncbi:MAG: aminoacyl--tRNA ligase-related protein [Candidatus Woesearchaeota archaeon]